MSSLGDCRKVDDGTLSTNSEKLAEDDRGLFHIIEQLAALEGALYNILDGLKNNATHVSFFCREYWGTSASHAQLSLERMSCNDRLKRQVQQACVLEALSLAVVSHLCSGLMQNVTVTVRSRLRNLLYYIHENCLVLLDLVCQRWQTENPPRIWESGRCGHCPENLNLDILIRVKRYRRLRKGEHIMALRQQNEMIANVARQLCRGSATKRPPLSSRSMGSPPGDRSPGARGRSTDTSVLSVVSDILSSRAPLDRLRVSSIRSKMLQFMRFKPLLNIDGADPDCPWPAQDPYVRYGAEHFAQDGNPIWYEPLPPMLPNLEWNPKLPPLPSSWGADVFTLVLDLDETLIHYFECDGFGNYGIRPGMPEFLSRMSALGYEVVIFTAATQDYADWVIDQIDPDRLVHHRLYRQHALPWGPIFVKDLSRLGRDLDRTLIIDNVQENFMLQPHNGIFIYPWYEDPHDTALWGLTPFLEELISTRAKVPEILDRYRDQIPSWAGFDQYSQLEGESDFEHGIDDGGQGGFAHPPVSNAEHMAALGGGGLGVVSAYAPKQGGIMTPTAPPSASASTTATSLRTTATTNITTTGAWSEASSAIQSVRQEVSPPPSPPVPGLGMGLPGSGFSSVGGVSTLGQNALLMGSRPAGVQSASSRQEWEGLSSAGSVAMTYSGSGPSVSSSYAPQRLLAGGYPQASIQTPTRSPQPAFAPQLLPQQSRPVPMGAVQAGGAFAGQPGPQRNLIARSPQVVEAAAPMRGVPRPAAPTFSSVSGPFQQAPPGAMQVQQATAATMRARAGLAGQRR